LDLGDIQVTVRVSNIHYRHIKKHDTKNAVSAYARLVELAKTVPPKAAVAQPSKKATCPNFSQGRRIETGS